MTEMKRKVKIVESAEEVDEEFCTFVYFCLETVLRVFMDAFESRGRRWMNLTLFSPGPVIYQRRSTYKVEKM